MEQLFDFSDISKCEDAICSTWESFRSAFANKYFKYNELDKALTNTFMKSFDAMFSECHYLFDFRLEDVFNMDTHVLRAARINIEDPIPAYSRFIPDKEHITDHNRFSPPGVEWLYLAFDKELGLVNAETCALHECRAQEGECFAICDFVMNEEYKNDTIVDLTIASNEAFDEINAELKKDGQAIVKREIGLGLMKAASGGFSKEDISTTDIYLHLKKWIAFTYAKLLANQIFIPITTEDRELMYAPFQCMAYYFLSKGYSGIIYSSTVYPNGKNIVMFDKNSFEPCGTVRRKIITS